MSEQQHNWLAGKPVEIRTTGYVPRGGLTPDIRPGETPDEAMTRRRQARRERTCVGMAPTEAEKDAAIREYADAADRDAQRHWDRSNGYPGDLYVAEGKLRALAARLPGGHRG